MKHIEDPAGAARHLAHLAIQKGSQDNVTVVVVVFRCAGVVALCVTFAHVILSQVESAAGTE